jgi:hypothetical protein
MEEAYVPSVKSAFLRQDIHQLWSTLKLYNHADEGQQLNIKNYNYPTTISQYDILNTAYLMHRIFLLHTIARTGLIAAGCLVL